MKKGLLTLCMLSLCALIRAQGTGPVAYPQSSTTTSQGHVAPLGHNATRTFDEARFQQLIPARYLPGLACSIRSLSVVGATATTSVRYESLEIRLSHASRTELETTFDDNLSDPVIVVSGPRELELSADAWSGLPFDQPFSYDGSSDLVIDIRKRVRLEPATLADTIVASRIASNPGRADLPAPRFAAGREGSGAHTATVATHMLTTPMLVQFAFEASTLTVTGDRGGAHRNVFALSSTFALRVHPVSGTHYAVLAAPGFAPAIATPPIHGLAYLPIAFALPAGGSAITDPAIEFRIPDRAGLVGYHAVFQAAVLDFATGDITWTNAVDLLINP